MQFVKPQDMSAKAKAVAGTIVSLLFLVQTQTVRDKITPLALTHPHWFTILSGAAMLAAFIQSPLGQKVTKALGIEHTEEVVQTPDGEKTISTTTEVVALPANTTAQGVITTTTKE